MSKFKLMSLLSLVMATSVQAHNLWILPSHFNVSADEDNVGIMADVSASNELFYADKPMGADQFVIISPSGEEVRSGARFTGNRKSVVDVNLTENGTYTLMLDFPTSYFTIFENAQGEEDELEISKAGRDKLLPKGATKVHSIAESTQVMSFVTLNTPTNNFNLRQQGLELKPITHPSDIAENETAQLQFLFDGKPQPGVKVEIIKDGSRYRNELNAQELTTDKDGKLSFTPKQAGRYFLKAEYMTTPHNDPLADEKMASLFLTFEAVLN